MNEHLSAQENSWEAIFPSDIEANRSRLEKIIYQIGARRSLTNIQTVGCYPYTFSNLAVPEWIANSVLYTRSLNGHNVLVNIHENDEDINHRLVFILAATTEEALGILPKMGEILRYNQSFQLVIPIADREFDDCEVERVVRALEFQIDRAEKPATHAQMFWSSQEDFKFYYTLLEGDRLVEPLTLDLANEAKILYDENYPGHSFDKEDLKK